MAAVQGMLGDGMAKISRGRALTILLAAGLLGPGARAAADWPQYRGPDGSGVVAAEGLLASWPEGGPRVVWRRSIGSGYSGVSVAGQRLYTMDADGAREYVVCLDAESGETVWRVPAGAYVEAELGDGGPRSTPTVADGAVYAITSQAALVAVAGADGRVLWQRDLTELGPVPRFGYAVSPLVDGDVVIVDVGKREEGPGIAALDRASGEVRWTALAGPAGYATPIRVEIGGVPQLVMFRVAGREVVGVAPGGGVLWRRALPEALAPLAMPLFVAPNRVFVSTAEDAFGGRLLEVTRDDQGWAVAEVWSERRMRNHFNASVAVGGAIYGFDNGTLRCLDAASGEMCWAKRGFGKGSLIAAGEKLFVLGDGGTVALVAATPEAYRETGRMTVTTGRSWTSPSYAGGRLYVRDFDEIVSLEVGGRAREGRMETE